MGITVLIIFLAYFGILYLISYIVSRKSSDNDAFFRANRKSPWYIVAIGMIGTSISGVTFVSVPGMVEKFDMTYMQMVFGFFFGYIIVAYVLLPLYYKLNLTSIYTYLDKRFGFWSYKTGAGFFILSRIIASASKLYLVALVLQALVFEQWKIPFSVTVTGIIIFIWLYTRKSGIKTIVWTDTIQTICFTIALLLIIWQVSSLLDFNLYQTIAAVVENPHSRIFYFDNWSSPQNFFKQFFSGIFIVIVMTGLDQDIMQKNLTCRNLKDARKNMLTYGFMFTPVNILFLSLGILLLIFASQYNIVLPEVLDERVPYLVSNYLGLPCLIFFIIGLIGASFANADSAIASLTTSFCVDILNVDQNTEKANQTRKKVHIGMCILFILVILGIDYIGQGNILNTIYKVASYTYGPLLGMFALGLFSKIQIRDKYAPVVCILAPVICYFIEWFLANRYEYKVGYEILMLNGLFTVLGLLIVSQNNKNNLI
ncbi:MAG: sodium:solute symporter [Dysgonomonas sp.]|nr:sodium:solute symporter [Dysgonomonas sp.]